MAIIILVSIQSYIPNLPYWFAANRFTPLAEWGGDGRRKPGIRLGIHLSLKERVVLLLCGNHNN